MRNLLTVMASLLQESRDDGVVPSAEFYGLKTIDRRLCISELCWKTNTIWPEIAGLCSLACGKRHGSAFIVSYD